jgi:asparagine synthase (glutamine-hydrolysing)
VLLFGIYIGSASQEWTTAVDRFAAGLGVEARKDSSPLSDSRGGTGFSSGSRVHWAVFNGKRVESIEQPWCVDGKRLLLRSDAPTVRKNVDTVSCSPDVSPTTNGVRISVSFDTGSVRVAVPLATPERVFYSEKARGFLITNDFRLMASWKELRLAEKGVYAFLQFGVIPAPLSLCTDVTRVMPGYRVEITPDGRLRYEALPLPAAGEPLVEAGEMAETYVLDALDRRLAVTPPSSVMFFSGGVDSGLMAARLSSMDRRDVTLFNFSFSDEDGEARLARRMAQHLGMPFEQVCFRLDHLPEMLARVGEDYSYPFGDYSTIPTNFLVHGAIASTRGATTVLEGTGGDGGFGPVVRNLPRWQSVYSLPRWLRRWAGKPYQRLGLWVTDGRWRWLALASSFAQRTSLLPPEAVIVAQNALDGLAYHSPRDIRKAVTTALLDPGEQLGQAMPLEGRLSLLDLIHVCAGRFAAKSFDPLRRVGMAPDYPFLYPEMLRVAFRVPECEKAREGDTKVLLKRLLVRHVPREWVYRPKSGFSPPILPILADRSVQEFALGPALSSDNPLMSFLNEPIVRRILKDAGDHRLRDRHVGAFLWNFVFASAWLLQSRQAVAV